MLTKINTGFALITGLNLSDSRVTLPGTFVQGILRPADVYFIYASYFVILLYCVRFKVCMIAWLEKNLFLQRSRSRRARLPRRLSRFVTCTNSLVSGFPFKVNRVGTARQHVYQGDWQRPFFCFFSTSEDTYGLTQQNSVLLRTLS